ncbi:MAG: arabinosidase [Prevotella sp.]|nr:arabinosidase [Prevotella sp.]
MKKLSVIVILACFCLAAGAQVNITVDPAPTGVNISPMLYGIFFEDINHAADGGIYAELVRNRSFEDDAEKPVFWEPYTSVRGEVSMTIETQGLMNDTQRQCLHVVTTGIADTDAGVLNNGFWGINAVKGRAYQLSLWLKVNKGTKFYAMLKGKFGTNLYASKQLDVDKKSKGWQHVTATLTSSSNDKDAELVISALGDADFCLDMVSLFPPTYGGRENGLRTDLVEMLDDLHPRFMRFPGGCFVEGQDSPDNAFRWERTIGKVENRPGHENKNWGYRTSDGMGFHEYLQLAEDIGAKPLYVCNVGIWHGGMTPVGEVQSWIDECMAALEYANGAASTKYGAMRAANGHPEPFNIEYVEIGNENNNGHGDPTSDNYAERYKLFRNAILAKYPNMKIIGNVPAWGTDSPRWTCDAATDLTDEHYYRTPRWFCDNFEKYDNYDRTQPKVYCGEYAVWQSFGQTGNLNAALAEAVFMMGMENNSDVVSMASYAPLFVNENDPAWLPDMIRFNSNSVAGTPSYYVQKMMSDNTGDKVLKVTQGKRTIMLDKGTYTPSECSVGVATYGTQATFADITVNTHKGTITASGKTTDEFTLGEGTWQATNEGLAQTSDGVDRIALLTEQVHGTKYSVKLRARKDGGNEGFIVVVNNEENGNYCWINLGGWGNTAFSIEQGNGTKRATLTSVEGQIETGRWYDVNVEVNDNEITAYLDGHKILETTLTGPTLPAIFTSASLNAAGDEMILKIVNTSGTAETADLHFGDFKTAGGELIQMKSPIGTRENTPAFPTDVYPTTHRIYMDANKPMFDIPAYSINILRLKKM